MSKVPTFYSINESKKPTNHQVHHNNDKCGPGKEIPANERESGTGGYRLCDDCDKLNK